MTGSSGSSTSGTPRLSLWQRFLRWIRLRRGYDLSDERILQSLNILSIAYAETFATRSGADARKAAGELLKTQSTLIDRLPRWWMAETAPAFTSVAIDELVYASEPSEWPDAMWPDAHLLWERANEIATLARQYLGRGPRFSATYPVVAIQAELLAFLDRANRNMTIDFAAESKRLDELLTKARSDFDRTAVSPARITYLTGVAIALLAASPLSAALLVAQAFGWGLDPLFANAAAAAVAGASGAVVSVLTRITNETLRVDYHVGRRMLLILGLARPILGAVLALALYWATVARLVPLAPPVEGSDVRFAFFIAIGFLAGFSERYAQDMLLVRTAPAEADRPAASADGAPSRVGNEGPGSIPTEQRQAI
jgi:hypothetical protein